MRKLVIVAGMFTALGAVPALADSFYIVREHGMRDCRIVRERPTETTTVVIGNRAYTTETEAETALKTVCVER